MRWFNVVEGLFRSRVGMHPEILVLRHQLNVLRRKSPKRLVVSNIAPFVLTWLCDPAPYAQRLIILKPATVIAWHRAGFEPIGGGNHDPGGGRPRASAEVRLSIREMSIANPLWGAPQIHGELLKLGIDVGQTPVEPTGLGALAMAGRLQPLSLIGLGLS